MMEKVIYEGTVSEDTILSEDGGRALIWEDGEQVSPPEEDRENGMFVLLQSWDDFKSHEVFKRFVGRRVRITVEPLLSPLELLAEI